MYGRTVGQTTYTFGHEGVLFRRSFVMYDRQTDSRWIHSTGLAVKGPARGQVLTFLPSTVTSWRRWKTLHPETTVLTGRRASRRMGHFGLAQTPADYGFSVGPGTAPKLYPFVALERERVINDTHGGNAIVVVYEAQSRTARAYLRGAHTFAWKDGTLVDETGRAWDLLRGARPGPGGERLDAIPGTIWLTVRWRAFYPEAPVYGARER